MKIKKSNELCAVVCFFDAYPATTGAGTVSYDFFCSLPYKNKILFQYSKKEIIKKKIKSIIIFKNKIFFKILFLPFMLYALLDFFKKKSSKKTLFIEGASWSFYSFFIIFFLQFLKNITIVYRSHNIEWEIRKENSNILIAYLTNFFEKKICQMCNIVTSTSLVEKKKFFKYYGKETDLFPNSISFDYLKRIKSSKLKSTPKKFIFYCGSYQYKPNKIAINCLINKILPNLPEDIYLVITGDSDFNFNNKRVLNYGIVKKSNLKFLYQNCISVVAPIYTGYGTRIKFIEALFYNCPIITTKKGFEGLEIYNNNVFICSSPKAMVQKIRKIKNKKRNYVKKIINYSMEYNTSRFISRLSSVKATNI